LTNAKRDAAEQFRRIETTVQFVQDYLRNTVLVWKRYFVSDAINQRDFIKSGQQAAVSIVQQPPLNGTKVAVWMYFVPEVHLKTNSDATIMEHSSYRHLFHTQLFSPGADVAVQTEELFHNYIQLLETERCTMKKHCLRTWVFVQNVDTYYQGMVAARRKSFEMEGLTPDTHFIASTGIEGKFIRPDVFVFLDAYAVQGLKPEQIQYLYAPTHLNPTHQYGVTFERGVTIQYGDRRHVFISGTASINNRGEIEHPMDLLMQTDRMFENITTLLAEADAEITDVAHLIVYLRDIADFETIDLYLAQHYPQIPKVIVWAPVCRPGWLVEAECMAIKDVEDKRFEAF
jgi:enamine deaminase RidA (YjgF/YER057c/UK114 family)